MQAVFHDAGHILGSAMIELRVSDHGQQGGCIYRRSRAMRPADPSRSGHLCEADYVVMESTYGDRDHESHETVESQLSR